METHTHIQKSTTERFFRFCLFKDRLRIKLEPCISRKAQQKKFKGDRKVFGVFFSLKFSTEEFNS